MNGFALLEWKKCVGIKNDPFCEALCNVRVHYFTLVPGGQEALIRFARTGPLSSSRL